MIAVLVDHDIEGQAEILRGWLKADGWLDLFPLPFVRFTDVGLDVRSNDRIVWRFAQANGMLLLTDNRNMLDENSLEQTIRDEIELSSLPVLTMSRKDRMEDPDYRRRCAVRIMEIAMDIDRFKGSARLFIP